jgi:phage shock protein PspC (stress-responsive transcriptional regulator)
MAHSATVIDAVVDHRRESIMSATTTTDTTPTESERRLIRPADDRVVAGVCSGLARYFGLDPLVYRIAFAALILLGGSGLILYAAAWLVIPDERRGESLVEEAIRHHRDRPWLVIGVGLVAFGLLFGLTESHRGPTPATSARGAGRRPRRRLRQSATGHGQTLRHGRGVGDDGPGTAGRP